MPKQIAIITGGKGSERGVSLASAEMVAKAIAHRFKVTLFDFPAGRDRFLSDYKQFDLIIPVIHGRGGEDGSIQGFLESLEMSFLFSGIKAHTIAFDKDLAKTVVQKFGVLVPASSVYAGKEEIEYRKPVVVKPADSGSSVGVSVVKDASQMKEALTNAFKESAKVLVEDNIQGEEYSVLVAETEEGLRSFPVIAIKSKTGFFDFQSKYDPSLSEEICPAPISEELSAALRENAVKAHLAIGARHMSRSDFIVDDSGKQWFLEINTIPGMTANSLIHKALGAVKMNLTELLSFWIEQT